MLVLNYSMYIVRTTYSVTKSFLDLKHENSSYFKVPVLKLYILLFFHIHMYVALFFLSFMEPHFNLKHETVLHNSMVCSPLAHDLKNNKKLKYCYQTSIFRSILQHNDILMLFIFQYFYALKANACFPLTISERWHENKDFVIIKLQNFAVVCDTGFSFSSHPH